MLDVFQGMNHNSITIVTSEEIFFVLPARLAKYPSRPNQLKTICSVAYNPKLQPQSQINNPKLKRRLLLRQIVFSRYIGLYLLGGSKTKA